MIENYHGGIFLKDGTTVIGATYTEQCFNLNFHDDGIGGGLIWLIAEECGPWIVPRMLVCAKLFEDAYNIALDELPTVSEGDLKDAFEEGSENLAEGYSFQGNSTGTGVVHSGSLHVRPLTRDFMAAHSIKLQIRSYE